MTQKIEDLIKSFSNSTFEEQLAKVKQIRHARTLERPVAAAKRVKKAAKKSSVAKDKTRALFSKLSPAELKLLAERLGAKKE